MTHPTVLRPTGLGIVSATARAFIDALRAHGPAARQETGKGLVAQGWEILRLQCGLGRLAPDEYYQYRLYDDGRYSWAEKKRFLGRDLENRLVPVLGAEPWRVIAHDKLVADAFFSGLGFPVPRTLAVYHAHRGHGTAPVARTPEALADLVRTRLPVPFVAKPVKGMWGVDVWACQSIDREAGLLDLTSGERVPVGEFVSRLSPLKNGGVLVQEMLRPHPVIAHACGPRICSVRMVLVVDSAGPRFVETLWKVATGANMADNYWGPGNLVGPIDTGTGVVGRTFTGLGNRIAHIDRHPDTGETLTGLQLPDWQAATDLCRAAASALPGIPLQAWDIALTDRGPVILEVNVNGGMRLPQLVRQGGLYTGDVKALLDRHGYRRRLQFGRWLGRRQVT